MCLNHQHINHEDHTTSTSNDEELNFKKKLMILRHQPIKH